MEATRVGPACRPTTVTDPPASERESLRSPRHATAEGGTPFCERASKRAVHSENGFTPSNDIYVFNWPRFGYHPRFPSAPAIEPPRLVSTNDPTSRLVQPTSPPASERASEKWHTNEPSWVKSSNSNSNSKSKRCSLSLGLFGVCVRVLWVCEERDN